MSEDESGHQEDNADDAGASYLNLTRCALEHPPSHAEGDWDRPSNGEDAPRTSGQCIDHHETETSESHEKDEQHGDHGDESGERTDLCPRDLRERVALVANAGDEDHEVLNATGEYR